MINKFKDFLKKLSRKRNSDLSDQDEYLDEADLPEGYTYEDENGETIEASPKSSWKDKLEFILPLLTRKKVEAQMTSDDGDKTGEIKFAEVKSSSFKDKFSESMKSFRTKFGNVNVKEWKLPDGMRSKPGQSLVSLSPSLSKSIEKFLSRDARETIHQVSLVILISTFTYTIGKVTALFLKGDPQVDSARDYTVNIDLENDFNAGTLGQVRSINIFRTNTGLGSKKKVADTKCEEAQQESNLPIKLVNTIVLQDSIKSLASVQVRGDRLLQEVREGEQISNLARIFKIGRLEILVKNLESGVCESIGGDKGRERRSPISVMSPSQSREFRANKKIAGIENVGNKFSISKALLDEKMKDIAGVLTQAKAIKVQNPDGTLAFKLTEMDPTGIFPYLGLQDQDIITSINGRPIYDMNEVMGLFAKIKNLDKLQLGVRREGSESVLDYNIKK
jgi:type II secretory pathway component PulC